MLSDTMMLGGGRKAAYSIQNSLLFRGGQYLSRTPSVVGNRQKFTIRVLVRRAQLGVAQYIFTSSDGTTTDTTYFSLAFTANDQIYVGGGVTLWRQTNAVYRDPSAWLAIIVSVDTTTQTINLYVNGAQVTSFATNNAIGLNLQTAVNSAVQHRWGDLNSTGHAYLGANIAEPILVDGAALTPSYFGQTDPVTGSWRPKAVSGITWGTNGCYLGKPWNSASLGTDYSSVSNIAALNPQVAAVAGYATTSAYNNNGTSSWYGVLGNVSIPLGAKVAWKVTPQENYDTNNVTWAGVLPTGASLTTGYLTGPGGYNSGMTSGQNMEVLIDRVAHTFEIRHNGVLANNGAIPSTGDLWPAVFSYNQLGSVDFGLSGYTPPAGYTLLVGGNNWTPTGFAASDVVSDSPTNVYATLNPIGAFWSSGTSTYSEGNTSWSTTGNAATAATVALPDGKWYWEILATTLTNRTQWGVATRTCLTDTSGNDAVSGLYAHDSVGILYNQTVQNASWSAASSSGSIVQVACYKSGAAVQIWFGNGGIWYNGGNPSSLASPALSVVETNDVFPLLRKTNATAATCSINFGRTAFTYAPPNGFQALCTANLPAPTITQPKKHMGVVTYTGNAGTKSVVGVGFQPDFVWVKSRGTGIEQDHRLWDSVRGVTKQLYSNLTKAEDTVPTPLTSFDSDGFSLSNANGSNENGVSYVAWCWKASGAAVANTAGSIASQVSANPAAGFSIVTWTGNGVAGSTVGHGLSATPKFIIIKVRNGTYDWQVWHSNINATPQNGAVFLNLTSAFQTSPNCWNNTAPTSNVITLGSTLSTNSSGSTYVAYCWSEIPGFSKFGSYTGNNSADGPYVYCGFRPRYVLIKRTDSSGDWWIQDATRDQNNAVNYGLHANTSDIEFNNNGVLDIDATGFKVRATNVGWNASGGTYIFAAFAEYPLGGGKVTPAKAR
ncbi:MAG TPA: hypothetical protein VL974_02755 [Magnetospirillum sp.]|jgi:hypothetical protein|nr:hypothetical protein [Magnetospirillum sp.]